jgi:serine/threonine-protein kinase HipA
MAGQEQELEIWQGDTPIRVGTLQLSGRGGRLHSVFQYAPEWLQHPERFALAPSMPLHADRFFYRAQAGVAHASALPPPLADTVPDQWGRRLMEKAHRHSHGSPLHEFDYFLGVDDGSRLGALRVRDPDTGTFLASAPEGTQRIPPVLAIGELVADIHRIERNQASHSVLEQIIRGGSSLGGARPKCTVLEEDGSLALAKFTSVHDNRPIEKAEVLTLQLAARCGIRTPPARLVRCADFPVAIIHRFDRGPTGRKHYLSAQSFLDLPTAEGGTYVEFCERLRECSGAAIQECTELFRRVSFTILVSNTDDHLRNHGLLYQRENGWILSPVFDVNPSPYRERVLKTAIADPAEPEASISLLLDHAPFFGLAHEEAIQIVHDQAMTISQHWRQLAKACGLTRAEIDDYAQAFEHSQMQEALALGKPAVPVPGTSSKARKPRKP